MEAAIKRPASSLFETPAVKFPKLVIDAKLIWPIVWK